MQFCAYVKYRSIENKVKRNYTILLCDARPPSSISPRRDLRYLSSGEDGKLVLALFSMPAL